MDLDFFVDEATGKAPGFPVLAAWWSEEAEGDEDVQAALVQLANGAERAEVDDLVLVRVGPCRECGRVVRAGRVRCGFCGFAVTESVTASGRCEVVRPG